MSYLPNLWVSNFNKKELDTAGNASQQAADFDSYESVIGKVNIFVVLIFIFFLPHLTLFYKLSNVFLVVAKHLAHDVILLIKELDTCVNEIVKSAVELSIGDSNSRQLINIDYLLSLTAEIGLKYVIWRVKIWTQLLGGARDKAYSLIRDEFFAVLMANQRCTMLTSFYRAICNISCRDGPERVKIFTCCLMPIELPRSQFG